MINDPVVMYVLMRTDLASMNPGKACAQASHAANACIHAIYQKTPGSIIRNLLEEWQGETNQGFGTCIVLGIKNKQMLDIVKMAKEMDYHAGIVHDPSYPLLDGETLHLIPLDTCAYVFCRKNDAAMIGLAALALMP